MTYQEVLDWMFAQLPMYQQKGVSAHSGKLEGIINFAAHLHHPEDKFKSIHVAGTNGKGSSSHMLASILQEAGYKVGLYTSPHLKDFRERIKINGTSISEEEVIDFIQNNFDYLKANRLSFFEMTVGMAFDYFVNQDVDIAVIEVGLGGRLDSTNIIHPEVSLITNIGLDHVDLLGDTLAKIAAEKAGIIKKDVPVVVSETQLETQEVFKAIAKSKDAEITFADQIVEDVYRTCLLGSYQEKNMKGVLEVIHKLKAFKVSKEAIKKGLLNVVVNTGLLGRWQTLSEHPRVVCDTAHNTDGLKIVIQQLLKQEYDQLHVVLGFVKDKDLALILPLFPKNARYYFCAPKINRGLDEIILKNTAEAHQLIGESYSSVNKALESALSAASKRDFVYVGGSTFVVAEIL
ncbi:bifunctional folylpolyglutamate synthase/dihydrofolate synthase [Cellulophaga baltica]|uniref:bifunctional folylpolyglutamate synthase/dihydrofolate synthase n=1 Tax=Cellulophaga baltica TaxID=76594 RepID=UPI00041F6C01|nr:folylpolyglutamate synthase/dihydrofolate synthase family protein [Cellulophaga baltica]